MDSIIRSNLDELLSNLRKTGTMIDDPVSKLMLTAILHQTQKIRDEISRLPSKVIDRICSYYIPKNKLDAIPALCFVQASLKNRKGMEPHSLNDGNFFNFKIDSKINLTYFPLYRNLILPVNDINLLTPKFLSFKGSRSELNLSKRGQVWLGLEVPSEIETLESFSIFIKGTDGILPKKIYIENDMRELTFTTADNLSVIPMMEPFDSQQMSPSSLETLSNWKNILSDTESGRLLYITDTFVDRDAFKCKPFPKTFQQLLESNDLDRFENNILWLLLDFGNEYDIPESFDVIPNVFPVVNVNINSVSLTQSSPIAKLTKNDGSYFLNVVETSLPAQKQGFNTIDEDVKIRDFDVSCYNPYSLYRDVRYLYNRFIDDYHAFIEYNGLKDGELVRSLRELVNRIGKSVISSFDNNKFDEGTYAMRSIRATGHATTIKVTYLTTFGHLGNTPKIGSIMENKKDAALDKDVKVVVSATGGVDKAGVDLRYEMLRYYTLTSDRLYTRMDIDAFLRMQLLKEFGKEEIKRISFDIEIHGAGNAVKLTRGLYIGIRFKDTKNYKKSIEMALDRKLQQIIKDKSCISMPIKVSLFNIE